MGATFLLEMGSCAFAGLAGFLLMRGWEASRQRRQRRQRARAGYLGSSADNASALAVASSGLPLSLIAFMRSRTRVVSLKPHQRVFRHRLWAVGSKGFEKTVGQTGLSQTLTKAGFLDARAWLCLGGLAGGALIGVVFSGELAAALGCVGAALGWRAPLWALRQERSARKADLESHLSEMLEVVSLGLRSGLSFDGAFELYHAYFDNALGKSAASTQRVWQLGLASRESALRGLAESYDSQTFSRVVENIIRSLRFGSSLADSLEASALESRVMHKATMEEKVAKAPVKMLIPTAALILPAMLLLVLGPVLLEMIQGF